MRLLVTGTRRSLSAVQKLVIRNALADVLNDRRDSPDGLAEPTGPHTLVHGDAKGVDQYTEWVCIRMGWVKGIYRFPAMWNTHGKAAGTLRNAEMFETLRPDLVLAFPGTKSVGTYHMAEYAASRGAFVFYYPLD